MNKPSPVTIYWVTALLFSAVAGYRLSQWKVTGMGGTHWGANVAVIFLWPLFGAVVLGILVAVTRRGTQKPRLLPWLSALLTLATLLVAIWPI